MSTCLLTYGRSLLISTINSVKKIYPYISVKFNMVSVVLSNHR